MLRPTTIRLVLAVFIAFTGVSIARTSFAAFNWGGDCSTGASAFDESVPYRATVVLGTIPSGKRDVTIELDADHDIDIVLVDVETGTEIVAWPDGHLNGDAEECANWRGARYCYSGYNGGQTLSTVGDEWIRIEGASNRELEMRVYGYASGDANVAYSWSPVSTCNERGEGEFTQAIPRGASVEIGTIPAGKVNVSVELDTTGGEDVDVALWDGDTEIVQWPSGLLSGPTAGEITYRGATIRYSGYNGIGGDWGHEQIEILGSVPTELTMYAYGYRAGTAEVTYEWGVGVGATCGGIAALQCDDALVCKEWQEGHIADAAGRCHTENWCGSDDTASTDCSNLLHIAVPGSWTCSDAFECQYCAGTPSDRYVGTPEQCARMRFVCEPGENYFSNSCGCGCRGGG